MLPIGSIVYLKEGLQKLMILNRGSVIEVDGEQQLFDYAACIYPVGLVIEHILYFNEENIEKVVFTGYTNEEEERMLELYKGWLKENEGTLKKGVVPGPLNPTN